jgi:isoleucyl-tRNA synthetase
VPSLRLLLDTRQDEALRIRGVARELVARIQKLKKKGQVSARDPIAIYYQLQEKPGHLR